LEYVNDPLSSDRQYQYEGQEEQGPSHPRSRAINTLFALPVTERPLTYLLVPSLHYGYRSIFRSFYPAGSGLFWEVSRSLSLFGLPTYYGPLSSPSVLELAFLRAHCPSKYCGATPSVFHSRSAQLFLILSFITSFVAAIVLTMLRFYYEDMESPTRMDAALACSPILLFDLSAFFLLRGRCSSYRQRKGYWGGTVIGWHVSALLLFCAALSV
jgi:hypothetical protein